MSYVLQSIVLVSLYIWILWKLSTLETNVNLKLFIIASGITITLDVTGFGFATSFRQLVIHRKSVMLRVQILILTITSVASAFLFLIDDNYRGHNAPLSLGIVVGAFLFGFGMQVGNGCGSEQW